MWAVFETHIAHSGVGSAESITSTEYQGQVCADYLVSMFRVPGGQVHETLNLQESIVNKYYEQKAVQERNGFLRKISGRQVRLLKCGQDQALMIPYFTKIVLNLSDHQWVLASDVTAQYTRKGELCSMDLRNHLLSLIKIKARVCIRALETIKLE